MAYICEKDIECEKCEHYRYDPDYGALACFAQQDEREKTFFIPVAYEMYGRVPIKAFTIEEAFRKAEACIKDLPLPSSADYVEDSFEIDTQGVAFDENGNGYNLEVC